MVFATLDLLPKNLYLFLLKENKLCISDKIAQKWKPTSVVMAENQTLMHVPNCSLQRVDIPIIG